MQVGLYNCSSPFTPVLVDSYVVQWVAHWTRIPKVLGSNPSGGNFCCFHSSSRGRLLKCSEAPMWYPKCRHVLTHTRLFLVLKVPFQLSSVATIAPYCHLQLNTLHVGFCRVAGLMGSGASEAHDVRKILAVVGADYLVYRFMGQLYNVSFLRAYNLADFAVTFHAVTRSCTILLSTLSCRSTGTFNPLLMFFVFGVCYVRLDFHQTTNK